MALNKTVSVDKIEIVENGSLQIRTKTTIDEDGVELSSSYSRISRTPGSDVSALSARVQAVAACIWDTATVNADNAEVAAAAAAAAAEDT